MDGDRIGEFSAAMRASDWDRAQRLLPQLPPQLPDRMLHSIAELHMLRESWDDAANALGRMKHRDSDAEMRRKLCGNLASLRQHRPVVYRAIVEAAPSGNYSIKSSRTGHPTVSRQHANGSISMSADDDPLGGVQRAMTSMNDAYLTGKAIGLCGIGDGYLLKHLAENPPALILGREQAICLFEPDAALALACMMVHDFTGVTGPIEQVRFNWFIGAAWAEQLRSEFFADLYRMYPGMTISTGLQTKQIEAELAKFLLEIAALEQRLNAQIEPHYRNLTADELTRVFSDNPPRPPRALVITTRFSTVLQYSAADTADAFRQLGWEVKFLIEPSPSHGMNRIAMRNAIAEHKPDLIFQIDHLRTEYGEMFPSCVPAVCWIQDHLPNLMNEKAGAAITARDFVLTNAGHRYEREYGYPRRQLLHMTKATKVPSQVKQSRRERKIVFVSNAGRLPEELAEEAISRVPVEPERGLLRAISRRLIDRYAIGGCVETLPDLDRFVCEVEREEGRVILPGESRRQLLAMLWHPLNDALYRQQSLGWVAKAATKLGINLELYGNHWDTHPRFGSFARGYVSYGEPLEKLTRESLISLHIAPFSWLHQRLMDGYVAGGFFLMRRHPSNFIPYELHRAISLTPSPCTQGEGRGEGSSNADAIKLHVLTEQYRRLNELCDPIEHVRQLAAANALHELPLMDKISFADAAECEKTIARFTETPALAEQIAAEQRRYVVEHFTYKSQMKRIVGEIGELIRKEAA